MKYICKQDFIIFLVNVKKLRVVLWGKSPTTLRLHSVEI